MQPLLTKTLTDMPIPYDIRKDLRFKEGLEEGAEYQARASAIRLLEQGVLTPAMIAEGLDMPLSFVLQIQKKLKKKT